MFVEPALVNFVAPASLLYAGLVMSRRVTLPLRLPQTAGIRDWNYPSPVGRRPRKAAGSIYLGNDLKGRELWISSEDGRQHATVPGTTGAGKTTALLSFLANALTHASGFVLVDGKADNKLYGEVLALARRFGREDDVLCLNFMVASGVKDFEHLQPLRGRQRRRDRRNAVEPARRIRRRGTATRCSAIARSPSSARWRRSSSGCATIKACRSISRRSASPSSSAASGKWR